MSAPAAPVPSLSDQVEALPWYHTLDLPGGVVTPGEFDLRSVALRPPVSASLRGTRCLDVGTRDGF
jgi:tRNA (mo5U34)-methyltransferase